MVAQGNALGKTIQKCVLVLKGQHKRAPLFCPFRANVLAIIVPRACPELRLSLRFQRDKTSFRNTDWEFNAIWIQRFNGSPFFARAAFSKASSFVRLFTQFGKFTRSWRCTSINSCTGV